MKPTGPFIPSILVAFLAADLLFFPNCTPVHTPDHGPRLNGKGEWEHRLALQIHFGSLRESDSLSFGPLAADWTYSLHKGLGGGQEIGGRLTLGNLLILPNGLEAEYVRDLGEIDGKPYALNLAIGWHAVDWISLTSGTRKGMEPSLGLWSLMSSLAWGTDRFYGGPALAAVLDRPADLQVLGGLRLGGDFGPGPRLEGMALGSPEGARIGFAASGKTGD